MKRAIIALCLILPPFPAFAQVGGGGGNSGGFDSGSASIQTATPNSSSHAAGSSVGGLFVFPAARNIGGSGLMLQFTWISTGGSTGPMVGRLWDSKPTNTTCTDQTAFVESATDDQHLITPPFSYTPAAPAATTGDTNTYAVVTFTPPLSFRNQDGVSLNAIPPSRNIYGCFIAGATDTADESKAVYANVPAVQD